MPSSFVPYEISPECIFYARGRHRDRTSRIAGTGPLPLAVTRCTAFVNGPPRATAGPGALVVVRLTQRSGKPRSHPLPRSRLPAPPWIMYMPDFWSGSP